MDDLPLDLLRSFVAVAETGTLARAAARVGRTPSALSLQMQRLSQRSGRPLFRRDGRRVALTEAGIRLLPAARDVLAASARAAAAARGEGDLAGPVRLGVVQDFADGLLAGALATFAARHPAVGLQIHVERSAQLRARAGGGDLDLALCYVPVRAARSLRREGMCWLGAPALTSLDPLPLALLDPPCPFRDEALAALRRAGRRHRFVLESPSLSAVRAAVAAGLALTCRTASALPALPVLGRKERLPSLPEVAWGIHVPRPLTRSGRALAAVLREALLGSPGGTPG